MGNVIGKFLNYHKLEQ